MDLGIFLVELVKDVKSFRSCELIRNLEVIRAFEVAN
jgi:hypothetical protein